MQKNHSWIIGAVGALLNSAAEQTEDWTVAASLFYSICEINNLLNCNYHQNGFPKKIFQCSPFPYTKYTLIEGSVGTMILSTNPLNIVYLIKLVLGLEETDAIKSSDSS